MNRRFGVQSTGVVCPIIREGDDIVNVITSAIPMSDIENGEIFGITESVVARAAGLYVTVDEIADDIRAKYGNNSTIVVDAPIYSRNRFSMILKGIARAADMVILGMPAFDEVGNPSGVNPFTGVDIEAYYREIIESEGAKCRVVNEVVSALAEPHLQFYQNIIYCGLHDFDEFRKKYKDVPTYYTLADICSDKNPDFGLLGSNKATEERLKLFPTKALATEVCYKVQEHVKKVTGKDVYVCCYGDGCFKDAVGGIWEFADPVSMPGYTNPEVFESTPNEVKLKALIDESENDEEVRRKVEEKKANLKGQMISMGTTPRLIRDLLASLMDLTSGSGDRQTPLVWVRGYFN